MPIETASYISGLVATNPADTDYYSTTAAQIRLIKSVLVNSFPNITAPVTATPAALNNITWQSCAVLTAGYGLPLITSLGGFDRYRLEWHGVGTTNGGITLQLGSGTPLAPVYITAYNAVSTNIQTNPSYTVNWRSQSFTAVPLCGYQSGQNTADEMGWCEFTLLNTCAGMTQSNGTATSGSNTGPCIYQNAFRCTTAPTSAPTVLCINNATAGTFRLIGANF